MPPGRHPEPARRGKGGQRRGGGCGCAGGSGSGAVLGQGMGDGHPVAIPAPQPRSDGVQPGWEGSRAACQLQAEPPSSPSGTLRGSPRGGTAPSEHPFSLQIKVPGISPSPPADDSYEDAEPLGPGRCAGSGEHPTTAPPPWHPRTPSTLTPSRLSGGADTDSSHYESYGEDEDGVTDRAHYLRRPLAAGPDAEPPGPPEAQLCGFLWRKRWLGRWAKRLFIVRGHVLLVRGRDGGVGGGPRALPTLPCLRSASGVPPTRSRCWSWTCGAAASPTKPSVARGCRTP